jgi:hypothetical protein
MPELSKARQTSILADAVVDTEQFNDSAAANAALAALEGGEKTTVSPSGETVSVGFTQFLRPIRYSDSTTFQDRKSIITLRREITNPVGIVPSTWITAIGRGDNASFKGVSGGFIDVRDSNSILSSERGVLYGLQITVAPRFARNNIPYDDVACLVLQHNGTDASAHGTDALYIGSNSTYFPGGAMEWVTGMTIGANVGYGYRTTGHQFTGFNSSGQMRAEAGSSYAFHADGEVQSTVTSNAYMFRSFPSVNNSSFTCDSVTHFSAAQGTIGASATVTNQYGFRVSSSIAGALNNYGFRSDIAAATGSWGIYEAGGAQNYFTGRTIIGSAATAVSSALGVSGNFQLVGGGTQTSAIFARYSADANGGSLTFAKSRDTTVGGQSVVSSNDTLGTLAFEGSDGDQLHRGATVTAQVDGAAANNSMPGRLLFLTTASGSTTPTERLRIDSSGNVIGFVPATAPALSTNSTMVMNLTSNTNLRISVRGTDGTTRVANITLA